MGNCTACAGSGLVKKLRCARCGGSGWTHYDPTVPAFDWTPFNKACRSLQRDLLAEPGAVLSDKERQEAFDVMAAVMADWRAKNPELVAKGEAILATIDDERVLVDPPPPSKAWGDRHTISLAKLTGKKIVDVHGYLTRSLAETAFKATWVVFEDGPACRLQGEQDIAYIEGDIPGADQARLDALYTKLNPPDED